MSLGKKIQAAVETSEDPRRLYEANLDLIEEICDAICRRHAVFGADAEDFKSQVHCKLLEDDCSRLSKFRHRGTLKSFLTMVIVNLLKDDRNRQWGKFRSSAAAKRLGDAALRLERLRWRDGLDLETAVRTLKTNSQIEETEEELRQLAAKLPQKPKRRVESVDSLEEVPVDGDAEERLKASEKDRLGGRVSRALQEALEALPPGDRLLLKMSFRDKLSVATIARVTGEKPRRLYTRIETSRRRLRKELETRGISAAEAREVVGWDGWDDLFEDSGD